VGIRDVDRIGGALTAIALASQRAVVRTARGPLRPLWAAAYQLILRAAVAYLRADDPGATAYLRGSLATGEPLYGSADIDLVIVVPAEPGRPTFARRRTHERWRRLVRGLPPLQSIVQLKVYEGDELRRASSATSYTERLGQRPLGDEAGLRVRPGLAPPTSDWRRIAGPELRPTHPVTPPHLAAWLELQWWWRLCFDACLYPRRRHVPYLCLKLITQSARVRLWLERGEIASGHTNTLARARATMPDEEAALVMAERLWQELPRSPEPPLADALGFLLRTSARVAERLAAEAHVSGGTSVELLGAEGQAGDAFVPGAGANLAHFDGEFGAERLVPLADWRARTSWPLWRDGRVDPPLPDEALAVLAADVAEPAVLRSLAAANTSGLQPAVCWGRLLVLPTASFSAWLCRGIQFEPSDPVSFALLAGEDRATFPELQGWSAADSARRAVDAHAIWLHAHSATAAPAAGTALGLLLGAARAALFEQSIQLGEPELAVTVVAAADRLASEHPGSANLLEEASGAYRAWRAGGEAPGGEVLAAVRQLIGRLPAYESRAPGRAQAVPSTPAEAASP
jgi:predicted nucleotidyltransferase